MQIQRLARFQRRKVRSNTLLIASRWRWSKIVGGGLALKVHPFLGLDWRANFYRAVKKQKAPNSFGASW